MLKYGHIIHTRVDGNIAYAVIVIGEAKVLIDNDDYSKCSQYYWYKCGENGYPLAAINGKKTYIQNFILNTDKTVDHINHDIYDNRKNNLRIVNKSKNMMNSIISSRNTSGVKGVSYDKSRSKWKAYIQSEGMTFNIGRYDSYCQAVEARFKNEVKLFGHNSIYYDPIKNNYRLVYSYDNNEMILEM